MGLKEIISRVSILAKLGEEALQDSTSEMELIMIDRADLEALKGAAGLLDGLMVVKRMLGIEKGEK